MADKQAKILVHAHVFYQDMWPELAERLQSLTAYDYDLHITHVHDDACFRELVLKDYPRAQFHLVENRGFDVLPFVQLIQSINLEEYAYVVKIHTKRDTRPCELNRITFKGSDWRNESLSILESAQQFSSSIKHFEQHPRCGIIASRRLTVKVSKESNKRTNLRYRLHLRKQKQRHRSNTRFVAGTMFIARATILQGLKDISPDQFEDKIKHDGLFAHVIERYLGYLAHEQGMSIDDPSMRGQKLVDYRLEQYWYGIVVPLCYSPKINKKKRLRVKICKIPLPCWMSEWLFPESKERLLKEADIPKRS